MAPTLELSRHIFAAPTFYYKTGIAFLAWLSGHQDGFTMVGGLQAARSPVHLARVFELANEAQAAARSRARCAPARPACSTLPGSLDERLR